MFNGLLCFCGTEEVITERATLTTGFLSFQTTNLIVDRCRICIIQFHTGYRIEQRIKFNGYFLARCHYCLIQILSVYFYGYLLCGDNLVLGFAVFFQFYNVTSVFQRYVVTAVFLCGQCLESTEAQCVICKARICYRYCYPFGLRCKGISTCLTGKVDRIQFRIQCIACLLAALAFIQVFVQRHACGNATVAGTYGNDKYSCVFRPDGTVESVRIITVVGIFDIIVIVQCHGVIGNKYDSGTVSYCFHGSVVTYGNDIAACLTIQTYNLIMEIRLDETVISSQYPCDIAAPPVTFWIQFESASFFLQFQISLRIDIQIQIRQVCTTIGSCVAVKGCLCITGRIQHICADYDPFVRSIHGCSVVCDIGCSADTVEHCIGHCHMEDVIYGSVFLCCGAVCFVLCNLSACHLLTDCDIGIRRCIDGQRACLEFCVQRQYRRIFCNCHTLRFCRHDIVRFHIRIRWCHCQIVRNRITCTQQCRIYGISTSIFIRIAYGRCAYLIGQLYGKIICIRFLSVKFICHGYFRQTQVGTDGMSVHGTCLTVREGECSAAQASALCADCTVGIRARIQCHGINVVCIVKFCICTDVCDHLFRIKDVMSCFIETCGWSKFQSVCCQDSLWYIDFHIVWLLCDGYVAGSFHTVTQCICCSGGNDSMPRCQTGNLPIFHTDNLRCGTAPAYCGQRSFRCHRCFQCPAVALEQIDFRIG